MRSLIVLLPQDLSGSASEFPFVLTDESQAASTHGSASAAQLPRPGGAAAEVVAVVPAHALSWHRVELPKGVAPGSPRLRGVLEGLLEELLLDDPEALHFALGPATADTARWVAVCRRDSLRAALQTLEAGDRAVTRIVPEFAPEGPGTLCALGDVQQPWIVAAGADGVLQLPLSSACLPLLPAWSLDGPCHAEPGVAALAEQLLQRQVELQPAPQRWLQSARSPWDLAQFEFASSSRARTLKKAAALSGSLLRAPHWRPMRWGVSALMAANLLGLNAWAWKERAALEERRAGIQRTLTETFPSVKVVVDPLLQMEREVGALRQRTGTSSGRDFEAMLAALSASTPPGHAATAMEFLGDRLRVGGLGLAPDTLSAVSASLRSQGYRATLEGDVLVLVREAAQ